MAVPGFCVGATAAGRAGGEMLCVDLKQQVHARSPVCAYHRQGPGRNRVWVISYDWVRWLLQRRDVDSTAIHPSCHVLGSVEALALVHVHVYTHASACAC